MTYIVPHFRYGSLMFQPEPTKDNVISPYTMTFIKLYNQTIKTTWKLPQSTNQTIIKKVMGSWNAETMIACNYVANVNKWTEIYKEEDDQQNHQAAIKSIISKYKEINDKFGGNEAHRLEKETIQRQATL